MRKPCLVHALLFVGLLTASLAQAHLTLVEPKARTNDSDLIEDPCGEIPPGTAVASYPPGATIEITVRLAVDHVNTLHTLVSHDSFASRSLLATIPTSGQGRYMMTVPLPKQPLGPAVLQVTDGTYVSCADITLSETEPFEINAGLNDAWYFPGTEGQGFLIIIFPEIQALFLAWFTYDTERPPEDVQAILGDPGHRWITAQGPFEGDTALLDIVETKGGIFDMTEPVPVSSDPGSVGSMEVIFENCSRGVVKYDLPGLDLMGEVPIQRIVNDNVALCEALDEP